MTMHSNQEEAGFSLVEVMISVFLFAFCLLGLAQLQLTALHANLKARGSTEAASLAQGKLDELRLLPFDHPALADGDAVGASGYSLAGLEMTGVDADGLQTGIDLSGRTYDMYWNVADDVPVAGAKTVRMIVCWNGGAGENRVQIDSVIAPRLAGI